MQDIINSFKAHLYDRTNSPLPGSFTFYWIICNYKLIMIIFDGEMKLNEKFDLIKTIYPQEKISLWNGFDIYYQVLLGTGLLIPLSLTLIYILILPFASNFIYWLWIKHQNKLKQISNDKVLTKKEFSDLQKKFIELEVSFDETFSKKDSEITKLNRLLEEKNSIYIENKLKLEEKYIENKELNLKLQEVEKNIKDLSNIKEESLKQQEMINYIMKNIISKDKENQKLIEEKYPHIINNKIDLKRMSDLLNNFK